MTSFPLRWPPALKARAQERAAAVGLSLNGFVCVALDAYLSASVPPPAMPPHLLQCPPCISPSGPSSGPSLSTGPSGPSITPSSSTGPSGPSSGPSSSIESAAASR